jgi:hypothetical protein
MKKGWHQRKHKRTSKKGTTYKAGRMKMKVSSSVEDFMKKHTCCGHKVKHSKRNDSQLQGSIEMWWCPHCGLSLTKTVGYLDEEEIPK